MDKYSKLTDEQLLDLNRQNDETALAEIYNRYWDKLLSVAVNRLGVEAEAEECVQDIFLSLWRRRETIVLKCSLSSYFWVAVKYQVINRLDKRYAKRNIRTIELRDELTVPAADALLLEKELLEQLEHTISRLPEKCRMVYRLSRDDGKSNRQIAMELNISEKTVEGHLTRALKDIRTNLTGVVPAFLICHLLDKI